MPGHCLTFFLIDYVGELESGGEGDSQELRSFGLLPCSVVKNLPPNVGDGGFDPWVGKIPWRREWQPTAVFLPEKSYGQRSLAGYLAVKQQQHCVPRLERCSRQGIEKTNLALAL